MIRTKSCMAAIKQSRKLWIGLPMFLLLAGLSSCSGRTETPILQYMPHMANTPNLKAMKGYDGFGNGSSMLVPPEHTIARGRRRVGTSRTPRVARSPQGTRWWP